MGTERTIACIDLDLLEGEITWIDAAVSQAPERDHPAEIVRASDPTE
jgi:hypothetical protein